MSMQLLFVPRSAQWSILSVESAVILVCLAVVFLLCRWAVDFSVCLGMDPTRMAQACHDEGSWNYEKEGTALVAVTYALTR